MKIVSDELCTGCGVCKIKCPYGAISMEYRKAFLYPVVDESKCVNCEICKNVCPLLKNAYPMQEEPSAFYGVIHNNWEVRKQSSTGGAFSLIAEEVIRRNGVVFGAAFTADFEVRHIGVAVTEDLKELRQSKYVQSNTLSAYTEIINLLGQGKLVLYSGCPCQVAGLLQITGVHDNLYTVDFVCNSITSPLYWADYVREMEKEYGSKLQKINMRTKSRPWTLFAQEFAFANSCTNIGSDNYVMAFCSYHLISRSCCYQCKFREKKQKSDFTLADFWNVRDFDDDLFDDGGTSLMIVHTQRGEDLFEHCKPFCTQKKVTLSDEWLGKNLPMITNQPTPSVYRSEFNDRFGKGESVLKLIKEYISK